MALGMGCRFDGFPHLGYYASDLSLAGLVDFTHSPLAKYPKVFKAGSLVWNSGGNNILEGVWYMDTVAGSI